MSAGLLHFKPEMRRVEAYMQSVWNGAEGLARRVADYVSENRGKHLRPKLVILSSRANQVYSREPEGGDERVLRMAASIEVLHIASLLHDDVIDHAESRRGRPSINSRFGEDVAILSADLMFSEAFGMVLPELDGNILRLLLSTTRTMCESELMEIELRDSVINEQQYYRIIASKTARLFSACTEMGALLASFDEERRKHLARFGEEIGLAFQIRDDALDYTGEADRLGKPVGNDLSHGKQTLPLVHAFQAADEADREILLQELKNGRRMEKVMPLIDKYGGLEYTQEKADEHINRAIAEIPKFAGDEAARWFEKFSRMIVNRDY
ncbi:MAG: polyprenyl synthetase family protein [Candidatus Sumerlaeia bacterium]